MTSKELCRIIGKIDGKFLEEVEEERMEKNSQRKGMRKWRPAIIVAACFGLLAVVVFSWNLWGKQDNRRNINLERSDKGIQAYTLGEVPSVSVNNDLAYLTEEEIFTKWDTAIFRGTVRAIQNIAIKHDFWEEYRAIATICVDEVFRGDCEIGDTVTLLLPCPIHMEEYWVEDSGVVSHMRVGMSGIFMPMKYDENSVSIYYKEEGRTEMKLYMLDLAEYGLPDGVRFAFLDTEKGLIYGEFAYESLTGASTLEDIEAYIRKMLQ